RFRVVAALDPDDAGRRAAARYEELFAARGGAPLARVELSSDVNDFFRHRPTAAIELALLTEAALEKRC
ncbi:MAG TPA: hypothetical protein VM866_10560, partial [Pyrinomonadaceae bacterium]|nr:hypothetical protein [Pyrinomonadaceae bacterium]